MVELSTATLADIGLPAHSGPTVFSLPLTCSSEHPAFAPQARLGGYLIVKVQSHSINRSQTLSLCDAPRPARQESPS